MEAVAALGLACNIIQLAGIATKSVVLCKQAYEHGSIIEHLEYKSNCSDLRKAYVVLEQSLNTSQGQQDARIRTIAKRYIEVSKQLDDELLKLDPRPAAGSSTNKFRQWGKAVRSTWKAGRIDDIKAKLDEYEKVMDTQILVRLSILVQEMDRSTRESMIRTDQRLDVITQKLDAGPTCIQDLTVGLEQSLHRIEAGLDGTNLRIHEVKIAINSETHRNKFRDLEASLMFDGMHVRQESIKEHHQETFQWIFRDLSNAKWSSFTHWLQQDDQLYWIFGKPGSGKSTLMNYVVQDSRVVEQLSRDHATAPFTAHFFFSELGPSLLHKSVTGLLRSLLLQLLRGPDKVLLQQWILEQGPGVLETSAWSEKSLIEMIKGFHSQIGRPICYFIDGLDECDDPQGLLEVMNAFRSVHKLKICASSRPERVFEVEFDTSHKLKLEDFTRSDIDAYIKNQLQPALFAQSQSIGMQVETDTLVREIGNMAEGVFLWVYIVVRLMNDGFRNGDDIELLRKRLHKLPTKIFDLYSDMWNRTRDTHDLYAESAAMYLHLVLCGGNVSLLQFAIANDPELCDRILHADYVTKIQKFQEPLADYDLLRVRVLTRCAGLVEIREPEEELEDFDSPDVPEIEAQSDPNTGDETDSETQEDTQYRGYILQAPCALSNASELNVHRDTRVYFIHRSVREFLLQDKRGLNLLTHHPGGFRDAWICVSKAFLVLRALGAEEIGLTDVHLFTDMALQFTVTSTGMSMDARVLCDAVVSNMKRFEHTFSTLVECLAGISKDDWFEFLYQDYRDQVFSASFLGYVITRSNGDQGFFEFVLQSLVTHIRGSNRDYLSQLLSLLACRIKSEAARHWSRDGREKALELLEVLLDRGGHLNMAIVETVNEWIDSDAHLLLQTAEVSSSWANLIQESGLELGEGTWEMLRSHGAKFPAKHFGCYMINVGRDSWIYVVIDETIHDFHGKRRSDIVLLHFESTWYKVSSEDAIIMKNITAHNSETHAQGLRPDESLHLADFLTVTSKTYREICDRSITYTTIQAAFASVGITELTQRDWKRLSYSTENIDSN